MALNFNLPSITESYSNLASFPATGNARVLYKANNNNNLYTWNGSTYVLVDKKFASSWGTLSDAPVTTTSVSKNDLSLGNVDNTSDADKPVSTATQTALNAKQNTLTLTTTGSSGAATLTGSTLNIPQYSGGGGGSGTFGTHIVVKPKSGVYYSSNPLSGSGGTTQATANFYYLAPFTPLNTLVINELRVEVNTIAAGGLATILIFDDLNGLPKNKLLESTNLDCSTSGMKTFTTSYTFNAGTTYWLGVSVNANIGFRSNNTSFALQHHASSSAVNVQYFKAATFGSVPSSITISPNSDASALQPVTIRFRQV
jgi:hypothetical protein